jgi:hypothetical protein
MQQIVRTLTMAEAGVARVPQVLICDRDRKWSRCAAWAPGRGHSRGADPRARAKRKRLRGTLRAINQGRMPRPVDFARRAALPSRGSRVCRALPRRTESPGVARQNRIRGATMPVAQSRQLEVALSASGSFMIQMCHVANMGTAPVVPSASVATHEPGTDARHDWRRGWTNRQPELKPPGTIRSGDADRPLWESQRPPIVERDARRRTDTAAVPSPRRSECDLHDSTRGIRTAVVHAVR